MCRSNNNIVFGGGGAMNNRLEHLLEFWFDKKDTCQWLLATIIETKGSAYRKSGARMLINSLGQSFGLLSGGCLEADLIRQAQKCWLSGTSLIVTYDMQDESDISWQLGIGCGGLVNVLLQPIDETNNYLDLLRLREKLLNRQPCYYRQSLNDNALQKINVEGNNSINHVLTEQQLNEESSVTPVNSFIKKIMPRPAIAIMGAGSDALPLVNMANSLGWHVSVFDTRVNYGRASIFKNADQIIKQPYDTLSSCPHLQQANVIIVMNHNVNLDAMALSASKDSNALYVGLLGPEHRTQKVFKELGIQQQQFAKPLFNPVGLDLGGELPESIALSILAQAHACIEQATAVSLSTNENFRLAS